MCRIEGARLSPQRLLFATMVISSMTGISPLRAEFKVGVELPSLSMKTTDGKSIEIARTNTAVTVKVGDQANQPKAIMIHLLQPDCGQCRAQLRAMKALAARFRDRGVFTVGIAHRDTPEAAAELVRELEPGFPVALGVGSEIAKKFASGDTLGIADSKGIIRFAQVGFGEGDQKIWEQALEELVTGKSVTKEGVDRERLAVGDSVPAIMLPSLRTEKPMSLTSEDGKLVFRDESGRESRPKAVLFFFSRYWAFSREEMVYLQKFHENHGKDGLQVFVIAMHPERTTAIKLADEMKITYPLLNGYDTALGKQYAFGWPAFILDAVGVIKHTQVGFEKGDEKKYEKVIRALLSKS